MRVVPNDCFHLTVEVVREIHSEAIARFGGANGLGEPALLESAVAAPQATFGGASLYTDIVEIAATYLFYICRNRPFVDGNRRSALGACIVFLRLNGVEPSPDGPDWEALTLAVAANEATRDQAAAHLRQLLATGGKQEKARRP